MKYPFKSISYLAIFLINFCAINISILKAEKYESQNIEDVKISTNTNLSDFIKTEYLLDAGDEIEILFSEPSKLTKTVKIMANGSASIPSLGTIYLKDQTISSAEKIIKKKFEEILIVANFDLILKEPRPIKISLIGEIVSPGIYTLPFKIAEPVNKVGEVEFQTPNNFKYHPTIVDAIQIAGGISPDANIDKVEISRRALDKNIISKKTVNISLSELFLKGDFSNNILLSDGDVISVKKKLSRNNDNYKIINANLLPQQIPVYVVGEVKNPGLHNIPINSTLIETILIAGGPVNSRANRSKIQLTRRVENDIKRDTFKVNYSRNKSKYKNPVVKENDIIFVQSTNLAKLSDNFSTLTKPIVNIISIYSLIKLVED